MGYHIIIDSVGDRSKELSEMDNFSVVPLTLMVGNEQFIDNDQLDQEMLLKKIAAAKECPKSACASPATYQKLYQQHKEDRLYVITASSQLTGSYNSAKLGEKMFLEEYPNVDIIVIDSKSASAGQTLLAYQIIELEKMYNDFHTVTKKINEFIGRQETIFVLEDISFLQKNGRLTGIQALLATALNIVPILNGDKEGIIRQMDKARGMRRALRKLRESVAKGIEKGKKKMLVISHCNCVERAMALKKEFIMLFPEIDVRVVDTGGIATLYAGNGGIVVSY